jgi:hypothetical protein
MSNQYGNKTVIELRSAARASQTDFAYEVLLYDGDEQELYVLAEFGRGVPIEMCRRFAADAARYFGAILDDHTTRSTNSFEDWLLLSPLPPSLQTFNENQHQKPAPDTGNNAAE